MARTFTARRIANERDTDRQLLADHRRLAQAIAALIGQAARQRNGAGLAVVPNTRSSREGLATVIWERVLRPYYIGPTGEALYGTQPQSPYAQRLVAGITEAVRIQAELQIALIRRTISDQRVLDWLTGPRPLPSVRETLMDSFAQWVDPRGFRLGDRILRMAVEARARVWRFLDYHIGRGTPPTIPGEVGEAATMAGAIEEFLTTGERQRRPYGQQGGYPARRLLRNEVIVAGGWAALNASQVNPIVAGVQWQLTRADTGRDQCDINSRGGPNGGGVYPPAEVPPYPDHAGEQCVLVPVATTNPAAVTADLLAGIEAGSAWAAGLQGLFNDEWLPQALLSGEFTEAAKAARR